MVAFISPGGDDSGPGTRESPFETFERGVSSRREHLVLLPGIHEKGPFKAVRPVLVEGEGDAVVQGTLFVEGEEIRLRRLWVNGGLKAIFASKMSVESTTVTPGAELHAIDITGGSAQLGDVTLECGTESCLFATGALLDADGLRATATATTKWGLRLEGGRAEVRRARIRGGRTASLQVEGSGELVVMDAELGGGDNGLIAVGGSTLTAENVVVTDTVRSSLLLQETVAEIRGGRYGSTADLTIGISGGHLVLSDVTVEPSGYASVSVSPFSGKGAIARFEAGTIEHGVRSAILVTGSELLVFGTRFAGDPDVDGEDAVTASGTGTRVAIEGASFDGPSGFGVGLYEGAAGTISATISRPRFGGILVDGAGAEPVTVADSVISGCQQGSGIDLRRAQESTIERVMVDACSEAGVVGLAAGAAVRSSTLRDNQQFGVAAFDGAVLTVEGSTITGSAFATFATCGDGARVDLLAGNRITGATTDCP